MKYALASVVALFLSFNAFAAEDNRFGIGFVLGDPTALSAKWYRSNERAFDAAVSIVHNDYVIVWGDSLYHFPAMFGKDKFLQRIAPYFGFGVFGAFATKSNHPKGNYFDKRKDAAAGGVRIPFGLEWIWDKVPLGIGFELAPGIVVAPATIGALQGGVTLRYYF